MISIHELDNGNLEIVVSDKEYFEWQLDRPYEQDRYHLADMLDCGRYLASNWHAPMGLGLPGVPAIAYGALYKNDETEEPEDYEKLWTYPDYMIKSFIEELQQNGSVTFERYKD